MYLFSLSGFPHCLFEVPNLVGLYYTIKVEFVLLKTAMKQCNISAVLKEGQFLFKDKGYLYFQALLGFPAMSGNPK